MAEFLLAAGALVLLTVALGLARILLGPSALDRMMAAQLLGTGGIAVLLLVATATGMSAAADVALTLGLVAALASAAFVNGAPGPDDPEATDEA